MNQTKLYQELHKELTSGGALANLANGTCSHSDSQRILQLSSQVSEVIRTCPYLDRRWFNLVRGLPLFLQKSSIFDKVYANQFARVAFEKLRTSFLDVEIEDVDLQKEPESFRKLSEQLTSDDGFVIQFRMFGNISEDQASKLVDAISSIKFASDSEMVPSHLFVNLAILPYMFHAYSLELSLSPDCQKFNQLTAQIVDAIDHVLGKPVIPELS